MSALRIATALALCTLVLPSLLGAPACTCQRPENVAAKERLSAPPPPDPTEKLAEEKIDAAALATPEVMKRVSRMEAGEIQKRLGSYVYTSRGELSFSRSDAKIRSSEKTKIVHNSDGDFSIAVETGDGSTQDLRYANGILFLKNNNGRWRTSRDPTGERNRYLADSAGVWRSFYDLFAHALTVTSQGTGTHAGRAVVKYAIAVPDQSAEARAAGANEPPLPTTPDGGRPDIDSQEEKKRMADRISKWRSKAKPAGGRGEIWVDESTGVPLLLRFKGALAVGDAPEPARLDVDIEQSITEIGKDHEIQAPKDAVDEIVRSKYPVNPREILEDHGIVKPILDGGPGAAPRKKKPAAAAPTPPDEDAP